MECMTLCGTSRIPWVYPGRIISGTKGARPRVSVRWSTLKPRTSNPGMSPRNSSEPAFTLYLSNSCGEPMRSSVPTMTLRNRSRWTCIIAISISQTDGFSAIDTERPVNQSATSQNVWSKRKIQMWTRLQIRLPTTPPVLTPWIWAFLGRRARRNSSMLALCSADRGRLAARGLGDGRGWLPTPGGEGASDAGRRIPPSYSACDENSNTCFGSDGRFWKQEKKMVDLAGQLFSRFHGNFILAKYSSATPLSWGSTSPSIQVLLYLNSFGELQYGWVVIVFPSLPWVIHHTGDFLLTRLDLLHFLSPIFTNTENNKMHPSNNVTKWRCNDDHQKVSRFLSQSGCSPHLDEQIPRSIDACACVCVCMCVGGWTQKQDFILSQNTSPLPHQICNLDRILYSVEFPSVLK